MFSLKGRRALITGASRGVGFEIAKTFSAAGAEIVATARNEQRLDKLRREIEAAGGKVSIVPGDLSTRAGAREVARRSGDVDVLVNNAAFTGVKWQPFLATEDASWDFEFAVNLDAPVTLMQALMPGMLQRRRGVVINISSTGAHRPNPMHAPYSASKAALEIVSRAAALEGGPHGVRVNVVALGLTDTEALHEAAGDDAAIAAMGQMIVPIGRANKVSEVANTCLFLASDAAATITGVILMVDGGMTAGAFERSQHVPSGAVPSFTAQSGGSKSG
jgi:NAD(P)-dependent dehydrogenase (short-subunit alcohol dehydrogenase family)